MPKIEEFEDEIEDALKATQRAEKKLKRIAKRAGIKVRQEDEDEPAGNNDYAINLKVGGLE
ncbi:hypothetical protein ACFOW6_17770 [Fodinicurvata halophila]|uniref:Uncharacterized protein n=1 Tax=Fodinicurvata halophila TaxID=1419723 RepID=A0ABV8USA2_9PROT